MSKDGAAGFTGQADTGAVHAGPLVIDLVRRAGSGDKRAWDALVERYTPLIWSICRRYRSAAPTRRRSARTSGCA
jgi:hypothetical protein